MWNISLVVVTLWHIWKGRNGASFEQKVLRPEVINSKAAGCLREFQMANRVGDMADGAGVTRDGDAARALEKWQCPQPGHVKINVDGSWKSGPSKGGYGVIVRSDGGFFVAAAMGVSAGCSSPAVAEAMALRRGVQMGLQLGLALVVVESDSQTLINMLNGLIEVSQRCALC